jgi:outer membrane protein TolC
MKYYFRNIFILISFCFGADFAIAVETITLEKLLKSSIKNYPKIVESLEKIEANEGKVQNALGSFDLQLNNKSNARTSGYYDGRMTDTKLEKNIPDFGSKIYGGYRISDGTYPIYEDKSLTNSNGEYNLGAIFSLLRNRDIDEKRYKLYNSKLSLSASEYELILNQIMVQHQAMQSYYDWLAKGKALEIYEELLAIAEKRQTGLKERIEKGGTAEIYLTENLQYLLKRKTQVVDAKRYFINASNKLSLFYRDKQANTIAIKKENLPKNFPEIPSLNIKKIESEIPDLSKIRPELLMIDTHIEKQKNKQKIGENSTLPLVDLNIEASQDQGTGLKTRDELEGLFMLNVSVPLQKRTGEGLIKEASANIKKLEQRKKLLNEQIHIEIKNIANDLENTKQIVNLSDDEVVAAKKMEKAEVEKFDNGASDFFVVNMREEKTADAKIKNIKAKLEFFKSLTNYYASTMKLEKLFVR